MAAIVRRKPGEITATLHKSRAVSPASFDGVFVRFKVDNYEIVLSPLEVLDAQKAIDAVRKAEAQQRERELRARGTKGGV